ncbi:MAG: glycosyltransferase family 4 protein [Thermoanaerobaculia bacterium]
MKVLHLASSNRWTGAAAPALAETEALRLAGIDAHYGYIGGYKLESRIGGHEWTHPILSRKQNPASLIADVRRLRSMMRDGSFDVVHAHLSWDHVVARIALRGTAARLVRTFHARRTLRSDPLNRLMLRRTDAFCVVNEEFVKLPLFARRPVVFTPPPVDRRTFSPAGPDARASYGIGPEDPLIGIIGKVAPGRGFEDALQALVRVREVENLRLLVIGHGEHRPALERMAADLAVSSRVIWAGYHETDLVEHLRTPDLMLFTAQGSDEGHRAVIESMACGTPVLSYPIPGVNALMGGMAEELMTRESTPDSLAAAIREIFPRRVRALSAQAVDVANAFDYEAAARRLLELYARSEA